MPRKKPINWLRAVVILGSGLALAYIFLTFPDLGWIFGGN